MDEIADEKKPFDAETENREEDNQPDPDEELMLNQGNGRVWLVKVPKHLLERWSAIDVEDVHLATIRVYNNPAGGKPRIVLFLPPSGGLDALTNQLPSRPYFGPDAARNPDPSEPEPDSYELDMTNESVENQIVVAERPKDPTLSVSVSAAAATASTRARTTILTGRIKHDCNLRPTMNESYRRQMKGRTIKSNARPRQIMRIEDGGVAGGRGGINQLTSGVGVGAGKAFNDLVKTKPKAAKGTFERMARIPRNQLLDLIFQLFRDKPLWGIKPLRERTQQPEVYLKEVLSEVASLHKSGEHNGFWELKDMFKEDGVKGEDVPMAPTGDVKMEMAPEEVEDSDEDEDMEAVT